MICVFWAHGLDAKAGLTEAEWKIAQVKKAMIKSAAKLAVITISEKLNSVLKMKLCNMHDIDYLITELKPNDKRLTSYKKNTQII